MLGAERRVVGVLDISVGVGEKLRKQGVKPRQRKIELEAPGPRLPSLLSQRCHGQCLTKSRLSELQN